LSKASNREAGARLPRMILWFALVTGLSELVVQLVRKVAFHWTLELSRQIVWLTPLSYLLLLSAAGLLLAVASRFVPERRRHPFEGGVLAFLCAFSFFFLFHPKLHKIAILLLGLGVAAQMALWIGQHGPAFARVVRRSTAPMLVAVIVMGIGLNAFLWIAERRGETATGQASSGTPNVLLLILDTVRAADLSTYGYARPTTPALERVARQGVRFERAFAPAPWTLPSHASMFTGRNASELTADWQVPLDRAHPTIAEVLRTHGFATAGFVANFGYCSYEHGLSRGFTHYEDYRLGPWELLLGSSFGRLLAHSPSVRRIVGYRDMLDRKPAAEVNRELISWLERRKHRPFFAFLNYYDAHFPYFPPAPFDTLYGPRWTPPRLTYWLNGAGAPGRQSMGAAEARAERNAYDGAITYLDRQIGGLLAELGRRGILRNTVVIITSDHGEQFGEHGLVDHGNSLYLPVLEVPLIIAVPGNTSGTTVSVPVGLRDLAATILDLARVPAPPGLPGYSLAGSMGHASGPDNAAGSAVLASVRPARFSPPTDPAAKGEMFSLVEGRLHYILNGDGREELYDVAADPEEMKNLALTDSNNAEISRLRTRLNAGHARPSR
jgi:arylsulfatase A-like enzyme